jgi:predicted component of type VI protein secretion system
MMNANVLVLSAALCTGLLAGCDRAKEPADKPITEVSPGVVQSPAQMSPNAAANANTSPPVQGQVDTKEPAQRRDFEAKR